MARPHTTGTSSSLPSRSAGSPATGLNPSPPPTSQHSSTTSAPNERTTPAPTPNPGKCSTPTIRFEPIKELDSITHRKISLPARATPRWPRLRASPGLRRCEEVDTRFEPPAEVQERSGETALAQSWNHDFPQRLDHRIAFLRHGAKRRNVAVQPSRKPSTTKQALQGLEHLAPDS